MELIRPTLILPPMLNNGEKTNSYLSGEASAMKNAMSAINFVNRAGESESRIGVWCNPNPLLPKTRSTSGPLACLILPACLFSQPSAKLAGSAAHVLTEGMSEVCMTREARFQSNFQQGERAIAHQSFCAAKP